MQDDYDHESYASYARQIVMATELPDRHTVQTLLVLSMYEWGNARAYRAWAYSGQSTSICLLLPPDVDNEG